MKIMFVINSLNVGGAERMLVKLANHDVFASDDIMVVTLISNGALAHALAGKNHRVMSLGLSRNPLSWFRAFALTTLIRMHRPEVIHSWLYQSDLVASIGVFMRFKNPLIWSLRQSNLSAQHNKPLTRICMRLCAALSYFKPAAVISCSKVAKLAHTQIGYAANKITIIPNGFDLSQFCHDKSGAKNIRDELGLGQNVPIIGTVGRFDSQKNYAGFFQMARIVLMSMPKAHFCMVGKDITIENPELQAMMRHEDINGDQIHFLGERKDITKIMSAIDILALPSDGEAFPNVVGEAMACETPSVVTDVGDCAAIVGETGRVVPPGDMAKFAEAVLDLLSKPKSERQSMGRAARARVKKLYDLDRVAKDYRDLYVKHVHAAKVSR